MTIIYPLIALTASFLCLLSLSFDPLSKLGDPLIEGQCSFTSFCLSIFGGTIMSIIFMIEIICDGMILEKSSDNIKSRLLIILSTFAINVSILSSTFLFRRAENLVSVLHCQAILVSYGITRYILHDNQNLKHIVHSAVLSFFCTSIASVLGSYSFYVNSVESVIALETISAVLFGTAIIVDIKLFRACQRLPIKINYAISTKRYACLVCVGASLMMTFGIQIIMIVMHTIQVSLKELTVFTIIINITSYIVLLIEGRVNNFTATSLEVAFTSKNVFVRNTAHEIRTPMNSVVLGLQLLRKEMKETGLFNRDMLDIIDGVCDSSEVTVSLVSDLLTHDKLQQGLLTIEKQSVNIWKLVQKVSRPFFSQAKQARVRMEIHNEGIPRYFLNSMYIMGDQMKLSQVFRNLLSNAIKFTPPGGLVRLIGVKLVRIPWHDTPQGLLQRASTLLPSPSRTSIMLSSPSVGVIPEDLESHSPTHSLTIEVVDSGAGLAKENQERLFKEVVQFHAAKLQGGKGSGIGLLITKGIVDLHDGTISVCSDGEGLGCTFTLSLPVYISNQPEVNENELVMSLEDSRLDEKDDEENRISRSVSESQLFMTSGESGSTHQGRRPSGRTRRFSRIPNKIAQLPNDQEELNESHVYDITSAPTANKYSRSVDKLDRAPPATALPLRMLIVDDCRLSRKMLIRLLCETEVMHDAEDGSVAVHMVKQAAETSRPYDVVLMDYHMPNMDGPTAAREIRDSGFKGMIIGVTGATSPEERDEYLNHGANEVLSKPVDVKAVNRLLRVAYADKESTYAAVV